MANMFSNISYEDQIPKGLTDCSGSDGLSSNLWQGASIAETIGKLLAVIIGIAGLVVAYTFANAGYEFNFFLFLILVVLAGIFAFVQYLVFHVIALLVGSLAGIYQNTKKTARVVTYAQWKKENGAGSSSSQPASPYSYSSSEWTCRHCGARNPNDARVCKQCGQYK